ncbi:MAG: hypothetical protein HQK83_08015, partial [Fibrobacteria bacterium]|nr:hypothetical protein [Fibrobacteria bacterium]
MTFHRYSDCLDFLYSRDQFTIKLGLDNIRELLASQNNPESHLNFIHVAGTNGKGSTCHYLNLLLPFLGYKKVGLFTSPHIVSFRERILVNGVPISDSWIVDWMNRAYPVLERLGATYFECVTAMAFSYFAYEKCDMVVLETGLGGRLDATNCVSPNLCIITPVSYDHMNMLGTEITQIWGEKIAIIKPGIPVVINENRPELLEMVEQFSKEKESFVHNIALMEKIHFSADSNVAGNFSIKTGRNRYTFTGSIGNKIFQLNNLAQALVGLELINNEGEKELPLPDNLNITQLPGRQQLLQGPSPVLMLLDGAHNEDGVQELEKYLSEKFPDKKKICLFTVMADKNYTPVFE